MHRPKRTALGILALFAFAIAAAAEDDMGPLRDAALLVLANASASPLPGAGKPIARIWRGRTLAARADEYEAYLFASGIAKIREIPGNLGVTVLRREDGKQTEFLVLSVWQSIDAIRRFAGKDYQKTVILDRDREYLIEVEPTVLHYAIEADERKRR